MHPLRAFLAALLALLPAAVLAAGGLEASVSRRDVVEGDAFRVSVVWSGEDDPEGVPSFSNPAAAPLAGPQTEQSLSIVNGRRSARRAWHWTAVPEGTGVVAFGAATLRAGGREYRAAVPPVRVGAPPPQPWARVSLRSDKAEVLVEESFTVTVDVDLLALPPGAPSPFDKSPLIPREPPHLVAPHLSAGAASGPCEPAEDPSAALSRLLVSGQSAGFTVNDLRERAPDPFESMGFGGFPSMPSLFDSGRAAVVAPPPEPFSENGTNYVRHSFALAFRATAEGVCRFAAPRLEGHVAAREGQSLVRSSDFVALGRPLEVRVVPPPAEGRPASFFGALGTQLRAEATLDAQSCRQGDPLALTLSLEGDLVDSTIRAPDLFADPVFAARFRGWGEPRRTKAPNGAPAFVYQIRPLESGTIEVPPIALSFYDTSSRAYRTVRTAPVPLRVAPVAGFDAAALFAEAAPEDAPPPDVPTAALPSALRASPDSSSHVISPLSTFVTRHSSLVTLLPPLFFAFVTLLSSLVRRRRDLGAALRRGSARGRAAGRLRSAETPQEAMEAVRRLLRDRFGEDLPGLTPGDVRERLARHGADPATSEEIARLLQELFDESFRPGADPAAAVRSRRERLAALFSSLRVLPLLLALSLLSLPVLADESPSAEHSSLVTRHSSLGEAGAAGFRWRQACASSAKAGSPEDFLAAAGDWRAAFDEGGGAAALSNYGACLLLAGHPAEAYDAFLRAASLGGLDPEARHDLAAPAAFAESEAKRAAETPSSASPGFGGAAPRRRLAEFAAFAPLAARRTALAAAWALLWLALLARRLRRLRGIAGALAALALFACILLATSVAASSRVLDAPLPSIEEEASP